MHISWGGAIKKQNGGQIFKLILPNNLLVLAYYAGCRHTYCHITLHLHVQMIA